MDWLIHKYVGLISSKLQKFKRKGPTLYNFRCPLCNDSKTHKNKARAYIYEKQGKMMFHCHNCNETMSVGNFIKRIDPIIFNEYLYEKMTDEKNDKQKELEKFTIKMKKPIFRQEGPLKGLKKVSQLSPNHPVKKMIMDRMIPTPYHAKLFSCDNFMTYVNTLLPKKFNEKALMYDERRLLIPFINADGVVHGFQGRSLDPKSQVKYITIILDESIPKIYGLDTIDFDKLTYVFEGPIDSMFIPNSIATAGGDLVATLGRDILKNNKVIVYDNEPRNKDTVHKIEKAINNGYKVCIWPDNLSYKDINDMIITGLTNDYIKHIIDDCTYSGLPALLRLKQWSKN